MSEHILTVGREFLIDDHAPSAAGGVTALLAHIQMATQGLGNIYSQPRLELYSANISHMPDAEKAKMDREVFGDKVTNELHKRLGNTTLFVAPTSIGVDEPLINTYPHRLTFRLEGDIWDNAGRVACQVVSKYAGRIIHGTKPAIRVADIMPDKLGAVQEFLSQQTALQLPHLMFSQFFTEVIMVEERHAAQHPLTVGTRESP